MIRVLFVSHDSGLYGAQLSLLSLLKGMDRSVISPVLVAPHKGQLTEAAEATGIPVFIRAMRHWIRVHDQNYPGTWRHLKEVLRGLKKRAWAITSLIERYKIDVVYTNTVTCLEGAIAAKMTNRPHVWHLRESIRGNCDLNSAIPPIVSHFLITKLADRIIVNSRFLLQQGYPMLKASAKATVIYNGIDTHKFRPNPALRQALVETLGVTPDTRIVVNIGAIIPRKDQIAFAHVASLIKKNSGQKLCFVLIGEGPTAYRERVVQEVERLGLSESFRFLGWRGDCERILPAADLLLVTARQEAFGRTIVEAMACGVPVVSTRSGGPEEIVVDGQTGYLVPVGSPADLAAAALRILNDASLARRLGDAARQRAEEKFSLQAYVSRIQDVILETASNTAFPPNGNSDRASG